jgi:hypothetical protein
MEMSVQLLALALLSREKGHIGQGTNHHTMKTYERMEV